MSSVISEIDVLVVGAGPVGLAMACELLRHGVQCRILDKAAEPNQTSRALGIQARTLEVFEKMGVINSILTVGTKVTGATIYRDDQIVSHLSLQHIRAKDSQYPFLLILPQSQTELILSDRLQELGGSVERSRELVDIQLEENAAIALVRTTGTDADGIEAIRARWLIGCDGARSQVRKVLAIPFVGTTAPEEWLLADVDLNWYRTRQTTHSWLTRDGILAAFPLPNGQWRLFAPAATEVINEQQTASPLSVEIFQKLLAQYTGDTTTIVSRPSWISSFKVNYRLVQTYRQGCVFLAGDAAHIHSPFGGQGMNIGIQDAFNLAWKLALVIQKKARESLLDTYQEERLPIAKSVLQSSKTATQNLLVAPNPALRWLRDRVLVPLLNLDFVQRKLVQEASELTMNYRQSSLSASKSALIANLGTVVKWSRAPHAGDRALPGDCLSYPAQTPINLFQVFHGTESHLLLFAGLEPGNKNYACLATLAADVESLMGEVVKAHLIVVSSQKLPQLLWHGSTLLDPQGKLHTLYGAWQESLYFIRPDGYIGLRSQPINPQHLFSYLKKFFLLLTVNNREPGHY